MKRARPISAALISAIALLPAGCIDGGASKTAGGLAVETDAVHGPSIIFDPLARPVPDIPFPNDLSLIRDDGSPSEMRWNVSEQEPSDHRAAIRRRLNELDGFGPFAPAFLSFDGPLDLSTVSERTVILVNIEPGHPREGERAPLDLGKGFFPSFVKPGGFYAHDPRAGIPDLVFPEANEWDVDGDGVAERITHYDVASHTLLIRPVMPLAQGAEHAVLITRGLKGWRRDEGGEWIDAPVRSPFPFKAHAAQSEGVRRALALTGLPPERLAFGWTYTTADVVAPMLNMREGVYGRGNLARLEVPPKIVEVRDTSITADADGDKYPLDPRDHRFILQASFLEGILSLVAGIRRDDNFNLTFNHVDDLVFGSFESPNLRTGPGHTFGVDLATGRGDPEPKPEAIPFLISVPKATARHQPPFPVTFYFHGTGTSRMESLPLIDAAARQGIAVVAFDEVGHGPLFNIPTLIAQNPQFAPLIRTLPALIAPFLVPDRVDEFVGLEFEEALEKLYEIGLFAELAVLGRSEDTNGDGVFDIAEGFFYANPFAQCASFWQDMLDFMQLVRVIRGLRQEDVPAEPLANPAQATPEQLMPYLLSGDFNADGRLDIGGPDVPFGLAGTSLGGFHSVVAAAIEPEVKTVTPIVAGGGLIDILTRADLRFITERIFLDVFGNVLVGCPAHGRVYISQGNDTEDCDPDLVVDESVTSVPRLPVGSEVVLENLRNGQRRTTVVDDTGGFSLGVESDLKDRLALTVHPIDRPEPLTVQILAAFEGAGYERNSSDFRRILAVQQHVFDRCDPINFARSLFWEPPPGHDPTSVLYLNALGDDTVPIATGVNLALASGVFGLTRRAWEPRVRRLIEVGVLDNAYYDVDDILGDNPPEMPALGVTPPVPSGKGFSSIRFADVDGKHEWIAGYNKKGFEHGAFSRHQVIIYQRCGGALIQDDDPLCLQDESCELLDRVDDLPGCRPPR